jgi:UDP-glucose 4-epimerase
MVAQETKHIGIVGSKGFISKKFQGYLSSQKNIELLIFETNEDIENFPNLEILDYLFVLNGRSKQIDEINNNLEIYVYDKSNFQIMVNLLENRHYNGILIFPSSASALYEDSKLVKTEDQSVNPISNYGFLKRDQEIILMNSRLKYFILRLTNVYGFEKREKKNYGVINIWVNDIFEKNEISLFSSHASQRDYLHVDDLIVLFSKIVTEKSNTFNCIYNVSFGLSYSLVDIERILRKEFTFYGINHFDIIVQKKILNQPNYVFVGNSKVKSAFKWEPQITLESGVKDLIKQYYLTNKIND